MESQEARQTFSDIVQGEGEFTFPNGDKYTGGFEAKKINRTISKNGYGEYTTWDGHVYKGEWVNDLLLPNEEITIEFSDSSKYEGLFLKNYYSGAGRYTFPDQTYLKCVFLENKPTREIQFFDKAGFSWIGNIQENQLKFFCSNTFYDSCSSKNDVEDIQ